MADIEGPLLAQLGAFLALLLAASAVHKALRRQRAESAVRELAGVPQAAAGSAVAAACLAEMLSAVLLLVPAGRGAGAGLSMLILAAYFALIARAVMQGRRDVDCGCRFGTGGGRLGAFEIGRNALLLAGATLLAARASEAAPIELSQLLGACALLAVYAALDQVMGLRPMRAGAVL